MKKISAFLAIAVAVLVLNNSSNGQGFYSMSNGSYMTGYGQVYGSFGYAMAVQNSYQSTQNLLYSLRRKLSSKSGSASTSNNSSASGNFSQTNSSAPKFYGKFRPDSSVNMANTLSNLFEKPEERRQMKLVVEAVQKIYKDEAVNRNWGNNMSGGMTFFLVILSTVYHDTEQPNDEVIKAIFDAVNESVDSVPEFAKASDKDKTTLNDMLVGFTALPFLTYIEGKKEGNADTIKTSRILAGEMIKMVLKTDPNNVRFDSKSLTISK